MKKALPIILTAAGIFFAIRFFRKAQTASVLNIKIRNLRLQPVSRAAIFVEIINPTDTSINFNSVVGDIIVNDFAIGTLNYQQATNIAANSAKTIEMRIKLNPVQLAQLTASVFTNREKEQILKFAGNISGEGINIPVESQQKIKI